MGAPYYYYYNSDYLWAPRIILFSSHRRRPVSKNIKSLWIPACAGMTIIGGAFIALANTNHILLMATTIYLL